MKTIITLNHWVAGSGFTSSEEFDHINTALTAQEWIDGNDMDLSGICAEVKAHVYADDADPMFDEPISESTAWIEEEN